MNIVLVNGESVLISEMSGIEVDKGVIFPVYSIHRQRKHHGRNPKGVSQCGILGDMLSYWKTSVEKEVCHAGKYALKEVIQEDHYENRRPHTCRGGKKKITFPLGKSQQFHVNKSLRAGNRQELLVIKPEDEKEWIFWFELPVFQ